MSAVYSVVTLIAKLTAAKPLSQQTTALNVSPAPGRPLLSLVLKLLEIGFDIVPALLAVHLLNRDRDWSPTAGSAVPSSAWIGAGHGGTSGRASCWPP
jgi:hypothetical protein